MKITITGAPNLDAMSEDELLEFLEHTHALRVRVEAGELPALAELLEMVGAVPGRSSLVPRFGVLDTLRDYARAKRHAIRYRLRGDITRAVRFENQCERLYASLPESVRW